MLHGSVSSLHSIQLPHFEKNILVLRLFVSSENISFGNLGLNFYSRKVSVVLFIVLSVFLASPSVFRVL